MHCSNPALSPTYQWNCSCQGYQWPPHGELQSQFSVYILVAHIISIWRSWPRPCPWHTFFPGLQDTFLTRLTPTMLLVMPRPPFLLLLLLPYSHCAPGLGPQPFSLSTPRWLALKIIHIFLFPNIFLAFAFPCILAKLCYYLLRMRSGCLMSIYLTASMSKTKVLIALSNLSLQSLPPWINDNSILLGAQVKTLELFLVPFFFSSPPQPSQQIVQAPPSWYIQNPGTPLHFYLTTQMPHSLVGAKKKNECFSSHLLSSSSWANN